MGDRTTLVLAPPNGIGAAVIDRLRSRGDAVVTLDPAIEVTDAVAVAAALEPSPPVDVAVLAWIDPAAFESRSAVSLDEDDWDRMCERTIRASFVLLQRCHAVVRDGGRVVVVLPTVAATGVAGLVPLCSAVEAVRVMAKAIARRWGARGITVNTIEIEIGPYMRGDAPVDASVPHVPVLGQPSLDERDAVDDVVALVDLLASPEADALTGTLLVADRGTVMQP